MILYNSATDNSCLGAYKEYNQDVRHPLWCTGNFKSICIPATNIDHLLFMEKWGNYFNPTVMQSHKSIRRFSCDACILINVTQSNQVSLAAVSLTSAFLLTSKSPRSLSTATGTSVHVRVLMFVRDRDSYINIPSVQAMWRSSGCVWQRFCEIQQLVLDIFVPFLLQTAHQLYKWLHYYQYYITNTLQSEMKWG